MADPFLAQSELGRSLEALPSPGSVTQTPGLSGLAPSLADLAVMQQQTIGEIAALGRGGTAQRPAIQQNIAYSPSTKKYWVNDTLADTADVSSLLRGQSRLTAPGQPAPGNVAQDWVPVTTQQYTSLIGQLSQRRGVLENVGIGAAGALEGLVGGIGRVVEIAGAPSVGKPIAQFAESTFGQSEYNQQRDALIQQSNSTFNNILDAVYRGVPSVGLSALLGVGGALGGAAAATRLGVSAARGAGFGAGVGAGTAVFPSELQGLYEAAQKNGYNVDDPGVQREMVGAALGSSILQTIVPAYAGKTLASPFLQRRSREIAEAAIQKQLTGGARAAGVAGAAAGAGLTEALAEGTAALIQQAAFDPEFRSKLSKEDLKALVPFIADKYGENIVIAMGAGALLGAGFGGAGKFVATRPVDLTKMAGEKSATPAPEIYGAGEVVGPLPGTPPNEFYAAGLAGVPTPTPSGAVDLSALTRTYTPPTDFNLAGLSGVPTAAAAAPVDFAALSGGVAPAPAPASAAAPAPAPAPPVEPQYNKLLADIEARRAEVAAAMRAGGVSTTEPLPPALRGEALKQGGQGATQKREESEVDLGKRADAGKGGPSPEAGRGNRPLRGGQEQAAQAEVAPTPTPAPTAVAQVKNLQQQYNAIQKALEKLAPKDPARKTMERDLRAIEAQLSAFAPEPAPRPTPAPAPAPAAEFDVYEAYNSKTREEFLAGAEALGLLKLKNIVKTLDNGRTTRSSKLKSPMAAAELLYDQLSKTTRRGDGFREASARPQKGEAATPAKETAQAETKVTTSEAAAPVSPVPTASAATTNDAARKKKIDARLKVIRDEYIRTTNTADLDALRVERDMLSDELKQIEDRLAPASKGQAQIGAALVADEARKAVAEYEAKYPQETKAKNLRQDVLKLSGKGALTAADKAKLKEARTKLAAVEKALAADVLSPAGVAKFSLKGFNVVTGAIDYEGKPIARPMAEGRVRMTVRDLLAKMTVKPDVRIFKDQADLKAREPALYRQAVAARAQGDFDTAPAAGYSFGDNRVIIFSDRIANESHLRFVLAHETLGHMGLRALMPANKFDPFMESLYDTNPRIRGAVDAAMDSRKLSKTEAVEEYLSDYAGLLETSMVRRVWDAIKGGLNKLGIKFGDEAARYWLDQAKRYVRTGQANMFDAAAIAERLQAVETGEVGPGRFSIAGIRNDQEVLLDEVFNGRVSPTTEQRIADGFADLRRMGGNLGEWWDKFKEQYTNLAYYRALGNRGAYIGEQIKAKGSGIQQDVVNRFNERLTPLLDSPTAAQASDAVYRMRVYANAKAASDPLPDATSLFTIDKDGEPQVKQAEVDALFKKHLPTLKQLQEGETLKYRSRVGEREVELTATIPANKKLTKEVYDEAIALRRIMVDIEIEVLRERIKSRLESNEVAYKAAARIMKSNEFTADERRFMVDTARRAKGYINDEDAGTKKAEEFLAAVNEAIIAKGFDDAKTKKLRDVIGDDAKWVDEYIDRLNNFRKNVKVDADNKFVVQNKVREIIVADAAFERHTRRTKRSIETGYIGVVRSGSKQVRVSAMVDGKPVTLAPEEQAALALAHFSSENDAQKAREALNSAFTGKTFETLVLDKNASSGDDIYKPMKVTLAAKVDDVLEVPATDPSLDLDDFLSTLRRLNINLTPSETEKVVTTLTATNDAARRQLQFSDTPGYERAAAQQAIASHVRTRASTISRLFMVPKMNQLLDRDGDMYRYWTGDMEGVMALKDQLDNAKTEAEAVRLKRELDIALYQFKQTNRGVDSWDGSRKTAPAPSQITRERANRYYNAEVRTLDSIVTAQSLTDSEFEQRRGISGLRAATSILYLGAMIANGPLNLASMQTNWLPYMATNNPKYGFGGGFGFGRTQAELLRAIKQVGGIGVGQIRFNAAVYFDKVAADPQLLKKHGLTKAEAEFIADQTRRGVMIPSETNALQSTALGRANRPYLRKFIDTIMFPFNVSEQIARRSAGLAAFRLEYDRQIASGVSAKDAAAAASDFAAQSLKLTLGGYNVLDRPPAFRQGLPGLLYTFKTYPSTVVHLMRHLPPKGQAAMLAMLWMLSGIAGLPFAEDIEDIVDTVAQQVLGAQWKGARITLAELLDEALPGISPLVLKGAVSTYAGLSADVGAKFSMGDLIPGTGIFLAGAKPLEELLNLAGPVASAGIGMLGTARDLITFPFSSTKTLEDVARNSPATFLRALGDASAYLNTGAIVDRRGYVVSPELSTGTIIGRLMGFYPKEAADQYDIIKYMNRVVNYQKEVTAGYRQAWIKAKLRGDEAGAAAILESVNEWNASTRGTALELRGWLAGSQRGLREAQRPAAERTLRAAPQAGREDLVRFGNILVD